MSSQYNFVVFVLATIVTILPTTLAGKIRITIPVVVPSGGGSYGYGNSSGDSAGDIILWTFLIGLTVFIFIGIPILWFCLRKKWAKNETRNKNISPSRSNDLGNEAERGQLFGIHDEEGNMAAIGLRTPEGTYIVMERKDYEGHSGEIDPSRVSEIAEGSTNQADVEAEGPPGKQKYICSENTDNVNNGGQSALSTPSDLRSQPSHLNSDDSVKYTFAPSQRFLGNF